MFISLRVTPQFSDTLKEEKNFKSLFLSMMLKLFDYLDCKNDKWIICFEKYGKKGEEIKTHFHVNFYTCECPKKDTLQKYLRTNFGFKGKECYSLQLFSDPDSEERFFRYCLKEEGSFVKASGFSKDEIEKMTLLAREERKLQIERNLKTEKDMLEKNQFRDKMFCHLKKEYNGVCPSDRKIWCDMTKYYLNLSKTPSFLKLDDLVLDLKITLGFLTVEQAYDLKH